MFPRVQSSSQKSRPNGIWRKKTEHSKKFLKMQPKYEWWKCSNNPQDEKIVIVCKTIVFSGEQKIFLILVKDWKVDSKFGGRHFFLWRGARVEELEKDTTFFICCIYQSLILQQFSNTVSNVHENQKRRPKTDVK